MVRKILRFLFILQEVSNSKREPKLGRGFSTARRLNPFNPLSYIALLFIVIIGVLMFGFKGIFNEIDSKNPFKWEFIRCLKKLRVVDGRKLGTSLKKTVALISVSEKEINFAG